MEVKLDSRAGLAAEVWNIVGIIDHSLEGALETVIIHKGNA